MEMLSKPARIGYEKGDFFFSIPSMNIGTTIDWRPTE
jgi:hypothetical protein